MVELKLDFVKRVADFPVSGQFNPLVAQKYPSDFITVILCSSPKTKDKGGLNCVENIHILVELLIMLSDDNMASNMPCHGLHSVMFVLLSALLTIPYFLRLHLYLLSHHTLLVKAATTPVSI